MLPAFDGAAPMRGPTKSPKAAQLSLQQALKLWSSGNEWFAFPGRGLSRYFYATACARLGGNPRFSVVASRNGDDFEMVQCISDGCAAYTACTDGRWFSACFDPEKPHVVFTIVTRSPVLGFRDWVIGKGASRRAAMSIGAPLGKYAYLLWHSPEWFRATVRGARQFSFNRKKGLLGFLCRRSQSTTRVSLGFAAEPIGPNRTPTALQIRCDVLKRLSSGTVVALHQRIDPSNKCRQLPVHEGISKGQLTGLRVVAVRRRKFIAIGKARVSVEIVRENKVGGARLRFLEWAAGKKLGREIDHWTVDGGSPKAMLNTVKGGEK